MGEYGYRAKPSASSLGQSAAKAAEPRGRGPVQRRANETPRVQSLVQLQKAINARPPLVAQLALGQALNAAQGASAPLPVQLQAGIESRSGISVGDVRVHYNSAVPAQLQAHAIAQGADIHLGPGAEHHLPHEAWHVVQQKQGRVKPTLQAKGVAINDDTALEREADTMGAAAASGGSEAADDVAMQRHGDGMTQAVPAGGALQRKVTVGKSEVTDVDDAWNQVSGEGAIKSLDDKQQKKAKAYLKSWVDAVAKSKNPFAVSQDREYSSYAELAVALAGEVESEENLSLEFGLAQQTIASLHVDDQLASFLTRLSKWQESSDKAIAKKANESKGRYGYYYSSFYTYLLYGGATLGAALKDPPGDQAGRIALIADYALKLRGVIEDKTGSWNMTLTSDQKGARGTHWNPNEGAKWTKEARSKNIPLSAGPSATTAQILALAEKINATAKEKEALAWAIFAFFNHSLSLNESGTHRFHEVMDVASNYGVAYAQWVYPEHSP